MGEPSWTKRQGVLPPTNPGGGRNLLSHLHPFSQLQALPPWDPFQGLPLKCETLGFSDCFEFGPITFYLCTKNILTLSLGS